MHRTKIEWTEFVWNPLTGCLGPRGDGVRCPYCYANKLAQERLFASYLSNMNIIAGNADDPFAPRFWPNRLEEPLHIKKPSKIFVCDMGELFGDWIPEGIVKAVLEIIKDCPWHTFQLLTKQPQNLAKFSPFLDNVYVGVSVTNQHQYNEALKYLKNIQAKVKFLSIEPLLEHIPEINLKGLDWIIIGGKSGDDPFYPPLKWIVDIEDAAKEAGIPVFEKFNLVPHPNPKFLRQEFPASLLASSNLDPRLRQNAKERRKARYEYATLKENKRI